MPTKRPTFEDLMKGKNPSVPIAREMPTPVSIDRAIDSPPKSIDVHKAKKSLGVAEFFECKDDFVKWIMNLNVRDYPTKTMIIHRTKQHHYEITAGIELFLIWYHKEREP